MNRLFASFGAVVALLATGCQCPCNTPTKAVSADSAVAGGYSAVSVKDPEVIRAAKFALSDRAKVKPASSWRLEKIVSAQQQVVAGLSYRMILKVQENGTSRTAEAVVWWQSWNSDQPYTLTSWTWQ